MNAEVEIVSPPAQAITVRACKYDGTEHRRWQARLLRRHASLLVLDATFDEEINHEQLGKIVQGTLSLEYYWTDRWYNVFRFSEPDGELRNYYCNVNVPPTFDGQKLSYIDLDMDILVAPDLSFRLLDEDEFAVNALRYNYPADIQHRAHQAIAELIDLIKNRQFPFDGQV